jgi:hypothetical protein
MLECGKMFVASFGLRKEIPLFLQTENLGQEFQRELQDSYVLSLVLPI